MMSSSIRLSLTGLQVDWTTNTSLPRTVSYRETKISPSEKVPDLGLAQLGAHELADVLRQLGVGVAGEDLDVLAVRNHF